MTTTGHGGGDCPVIRCVLTGVRTYMLTRCQASIHRPPDNIGPPRYQLIVGMVITGNIMPIPFTTSAIARDPSSTTTWITTHRRSLLTTALAIQANTRHRPVGLPVVITTRCIHLPVYNCPGARNIFSDISLSRRGIHVVVSTQWAMTMNMHRRTNIQ
jgi:hypothetical protein